MRGHSSTDTGDDATGRPADPAAPRHSDGQSDSERQMRQMLADPEAYFTRARQDAKREAHHYVAKRLGRPRTA